MRRTVQVLLIATLVVTPLLAGLGSPPHSVAAEGPNLPCEQDQVGDYKTRFPNTGGAKFIWRGGRIEASLTFLQDRCTCTGHEEIIDPLTGEVTPGDCNEWKWQEQPTFDRTKSPVWSTKLAFDRPTLMQLGHNRTWDRICLAPYHDTRGVIMPEWDGLEYDFRGSGQEEYHVYGHIFVRTTEEHYNGRSHCESDTLSQVRTVVNDKTGTEIAIRWEDRFDIEGAVQAAVAGLAFDQVRVVANPPGQPDSLGGEYRGLVGAPVYYWLEGIDQPPFTGFRVPVKGWGGFGLSAWVIVYPSQIVWEFGDGTSLTTTSRGVPWPEAEPNGPNGAPHESAISKVYQYDGTFQATARVTWTAVWGLFEEHTTLCSAAPPTPCSPFIPIYSAGPVTVAQSRPYEVMQVRAVRTG